MPNNNQNKENHHHHHHEVNPQTITYLFYSFIINMLLSVVEIVAGIIAGSVALIGDALHNTSDAFSILIAIIAYKIGVKKADSHFTYGFKRAETIGGFVNLILLLISGIYLFIEGISKLISPEEISGKIIIYVSILALIIDALTAKFSHHDSHHNSNMKMLFLHNLADALGSVGVIISGLCVVFFNWTFVDGLVALLISFYMIFQSIASAPQLIKILMNASPDNLNIAEIQQTLLQIKNVQDVHHIHLWSASENDFCLECHIVTEKDDVLANVQKTLADKFEIYHTNIQIEKNGADCDHCCL